MSRYSENEIAEVALEVIREQPGIRTSGLIDSCRTRMRPDGEDLDILNDRTDDKFSQKVRNLKSHDTLMGQVRTEGEKDRRWFPR